MPRFFRVGPILVSLISLAGACEPDPPETWPWPASRCPPGMVFVAEGTYTTGMEPPLPYAVVDTTRMERVEAPEQHCDAALARSPHTSVCWIQTDFHDPVVTAHQVQVEGYCMERHPFPGKGVPYPDDGLTTWDAMLFDELLSSGRFGPRRLCTYTEYELAVAGPSRNLRFIYGDEPDRERCPRDEDTPIGTHPRCRNPETGVHEYGAVIGQWVHLDEQLAAWACGRPEGCRASGGARLDARKPDGSFAMPYIVAGGTHRLQTRQAPFTPHTYHDHGQVSGPEGCDDWGWDDGVAVCAEPDPRYRTCVERPDSADCEALWRQERAWSELLEHCRGVRMTACLSWGISEVRDRRFDACPDSPKELGPGQGR